MSGHCEATVRGGILEQSTLLNILTFSKSNLHHVDAYQIIVADAADAVSVNFSGRCKFLQI